MPGVAAQGQRKKTTVIPDGPRFTFVATAQTASSSGTWTTVTLPTTTSAIGHLMVVIAWTRSPFIGPAGWTVAGSIPVTGGNSATSGITQYLSVMYKTLTASDIGTTTRISQETSATLGFTSLRYSPNFEGVQSIKGFTGRADPNFTGTSVAMEPITPTVPGQQVVAAISRILAASNEVSAAPSGFVRRSAAASIRAAAGDLTSVDTSTASGNFTVATATANAQALCSFLLDIG